MNRRLWAIMIPLICILSMTHITMAQSLFPKGKWWKHPEVLENVDITDEQIQKIEEISNEGMRKIIGLEAKFKIARMDLESLLDQTDQEKLDLSAIEKQLETVNRIRGELETERIMMLARIRNVLPKETVQKLKRIRWRFGKGPREKRKGRFEADVDRPEGGRSGDILFEGE